MHARTKIVDDTERKYFTIVPNIIWDLGLSHAAFRLYCTLCRLVGERGGKWKNGTATLAAYAGLSMGAVSKARAELVDHNLVAITEGRATKGEADVITLRPVWERNIRHFAEGAPTPSFGEGVETAETLFASEPGEPTPETPSLNEEVYGATSSPTPSRTPSFTPSPNEHSKEDKNSNTQEAAGVGVEQADRKEEARQLVECFYTHRNGRAPSAGWPPADNDVAAALLQNYPLEALKRAAPNVVAECRKATPHPIATLTGSRLVWDRVMTSEGPRQRREQAEAAAAEGRSQAARMDAAKRRRNAAVFDAFLPDFQRLPEAERNALLDRNHGDKFGRTFPAVVEGAVLQFARAPPNAEKYGSIVQGLQLEESQPC